MLIEKEKKLFVNNKQRKFLKMVGENLMVKSQYSYINLKETLDIN